MIFIYILFFVSSVVDPQYNSDMTSLLHVKKIYRTGSRRVRQVLTHTRPNKCMAGANQYIGTQVMKGLIKFVDESPAFNETSSYTKFHVYWYHGY